MWEPGDKGRAGGHSFPLRGIWRARRPRQAQCLFPLEALDAR